MNMQAYNVIEHPSLLEKARKSDYLYNDIDAGFDLANLYYIIGNSKQEISLVNMASGKNSTISKSELIAGKWQIHLIPQFVRRSLRME